MKVHYGDGLDPSFMCDLCLTKWLVPQAVRWDSAVKTESAQVARDAGWLIEEYRTRCPDHVPAVSETAEVKP